MNKLEQQLWDFIDGNLTETEQKKIQEKIENDKELKQMYNSLLRLNQAYGNLELEEPSMAFTRNVMEHITLEKAPVRLNTKVNNWVVWSIASFFGLALLILLGYVFYNTKFSTSDYELNLNLNLSAFTNSTLLNVFLLVDLIIGLVFLDYLLRGKSKAHVELKNSKL